MPRCGDCRAFGSRTPETPVSPISSRIGISKDGRGERRGKVFVEKLRQSAKYEEVYPQAFDRAAEARLDRAPSGFV